MRSKEEKEKAGEVVGPDDEGKRAEYETFEAKACTEEEFT